MQQKELPMTRFLTIRFDAPEGMSDDRAASLVKRLLLRGDIPRVESPDEMPEANLEDFDVFPAGNDQFTDAIAQIRSILWKSVDRWDPDKSWNSETLEYVAGVLEDLGLRPQTSD